MVINKHVLIGTIIVAVVLAICGILTLNSIAYQNAVAQPATANLIVIVPGIIPTQDLSLLSFTATPTQDTSLGDLKGIQVNVYVQITGTSGTGLRIRQNPGLNSDVKFIAGDSEVFHVIDGPKKQDGLIWWKVVTPYDQNRQGWAAADYLSLIEGQ